MRLHKRLTRLEEKTGAIRTGFCPQRGRDLPTETPLWCAFDPKPAHWCAVCDLRVVVEYVKIPTPADRASAEDAI